jgi:hypothetical protein
MGQGGMRQHENQCLECEIGRRGLVRRPEELCKKVHQGKLGVGDIWEKIQHMLQPRTFGFMQYLKRVIE